MTQKSRRKFSAEFKAKVVLEAFKDPFRASVPTPNKLFFTQP